MGTLRDEVYEKLDYLSQLTEVVVGPQNEVLGRVPDRIELTLDQINTFKQESYGALGFELNVSSILMHILPHADQACITDIVEHFQLQVSQDFELDLANQTMVGTITLVKVNQQIDEKKILELAIAKSCRNVSYYSWPHKRLKEKIATVLNTFESGRGTEWAQKLTGRAAWDGEVAIKNTISEMILENKWRVRDVNVILKIGSWINTYLADESDKDLGLVNLVKLKMMLDKDLPVYSVDEVK